MTEVSAREFISVSEKIQDRLLSPAWCQALTLTERLTTLRQQVPERARLPLQQSEQAERRLEKWKSQPSFENATSFAKRLAQDSLSEDELRYLLGETTADLQARTTHPPDWLHTLISAFADYARSAHLDEALTPPANQPLQAFLQPFKPLLDYAHRCLEQGAQAVACQYTDLPFEPETVSTLFTACINGQLLPVLFKTLTLELNIARLQEKLTGETTEQRFQSFIEHLCEPDTALALLEQYPVLARKLVTIIDYQVQYGLEFLTHLSTDWQEIRERFSPDVDPGPLTEINAGIGDTHRQGRSVLQLTFRSGFKLIYKPKSFAIDLHFQSLLAWLNAQSTRPPLRLLHMIDKGAYGWSEFVQVAPCASTEEVARFYEHLGSYLAIFYTLQATDMHFENLLACGEHPMFIDLEALFQPQLPSAQDTASTDGHEAPPGAEILDASVLRSALLPRRLWSKADAPGVDLSGMGGKGGQLFPRKQAQVEDAGTDQMRLVRKQFKLADKQNRPSLHGQEVDPLQYLDQIIDGFTSMYRLMLERREEFLTTLLPLFEQDEIRVILRPTNTYMRVLQESNHSTLLHKALDQERFLDSLWGPCELQPFLERVIPSERVDLFHNDVPVFTGHPDSCHLYDSRGTCIENFFSESSLTQTGRCIRQMDEADLSRQTWLIRASFTTLAIDQGVARWRKTDLQSTTTEAVSHERLLRMASVVGDRLQDLAVRKDGRISWLCLRFLNENEWIPSLADWGMYDGQAGIALFLAYLGSQTGETRYTDLARLVLQELRRQVKAAPAEHVLAGAFSGWGALVYLYTHLGVLWQEPELLHEAESLLERFSATIEQDEALDIVSGVAGALRCLLTLYRVTRSETVLQAATRCGDHLLAQAQAMPQGIGWRGKLSHTHPLAGFSHGAAGIALALFELADLGGDVRYFQAAQLALEYERSIFSQQERNWPDLRDPESGGRASAPDEQAFMTTWCHGAPGIGLARLAMLPYLDDATLHEEIEAALQTTLEHGFGMNHSLCHGDLGCLDVLLMAARTLPDPRYQSEVTRLTAMIVASIERIGWSTGIPLGVETPGLMVGIAGIGYELLRLADPDHVPSVLLLAPPYSWSSAPGRDMQTQKRADKADRQGRL